VSTALLVVRLLLAAVFVVAAVGKLADLDESRHAVERFGLPRRVARVVGVLLPVVELGIAGSLVTAVTAQWGAVGAATLLLLFCAAIARVLLRGETADCNCFGSIGSAPVGAWTLVRNLVLIAGAGFVAAAAGSHAGGTSATAWIGALSPAGVVATALGSLMALQVAFSWQLFRQNARLLGRIVLLEQAGSPDGSSGLPSGGLPVGVPAPDFVLEDLQGGIVSLEDVLDSGRGALLFFTHPRCGQCDPLLPAVGESQRRAGATPIVVVSSGSLAENLAKAQEHALELVLLQEEVNVAQEYEAPGFPSAVLVDAEGRIASRLAMGADQIRELMTMTARPGLEVLSANGSRAAVPGKAGRS
jgi:peroxiredoxin